MQSRTIAQDGRAGGRNETMGISLALRQVIVSQIIFKFICAKRLRLDKSLARFSCDVCQS